MRNSRNAYAHFQAMGQLFTKASACDCAQNLTTNFTEDNIFLVPNNNSTPASPATRRKTIHGSLDRLRAAATAPRNIGSGACSDGVGSPRCACARPIWR